jgi:hypothetical protein
MNRRIPKEDHQRGEVRKSAGWGSVPEESEMEMKRRQVQEVVWYTTVMRFPPTVLVAQTRHLLPGCPAEMVLTL